MKNTNKFLKITTLVSSIFLTPILISLGLVLFSNPAGAALTYGTPSTLTNAYGGLQVACSPTNGNVYIADVSGLVYVYNGSTGAFVTTFRVTSSALAGIAIDSSGNVWTSNWYNGIIYENTATGAAIQTINLQVLVEGYPIGSKGIALSPSGGTIYEYFINGVVLSASTTGAVNNTPLITAPLTGTGFNVTTGIAVDSNGNIWLTSFSFNNQVWKYNSSGTLLNTYTIPSYSESVAIDGSGNVWVAGVVSNNDRSIYLYKLASDASSFATQGVDPTSGMPGGLAVDSSGGIWMTNVSNNSIKKITYTSGPTSFPVTYSSGWYCRSNCGTAPSNQSAIETGSSFSLPSNSYLYAGHSFTGWSDGTTTYQPGAPYTMGVLKVTLTAQWVVVTTDTITFSTDGADAVSPISGDDGSTISLPTDTKTGYTFSGWFAATTGGSALSSPYTLSGSVTLYARWTLIPAVIVYSKPTAPSAVSAVMSSGLATVSFSPGSSGNLPTYSQIDMFINGQPFGNVCNVVGANTCPISNLGPDADFTFTVTAINSRGSAISEVSNAVSYASPSVALPTTTSTITTTLPPTKRTIACVKGKTTKKVTAVSPVCPAGYKKK